MVTPATEKLIGQNASDLLGHTLLEKFPNVVTDRLFEKFSWIVDKNETLDFEHLSSESDLPRWYRLAGVKLGDGLALSYSEGSCSNFGGSSLRELCAQIEQVGQSRELGDVADLIASAEKELVVP